MHWDTFKHDDCSTVGGDGDVGSARYDPALLPPCPTEGFYATVTVRDPPTHTSSNVYFMGNHDQYANTCHRYRAFYSTFWLHLLTG